MKKLFMFSTIFLLFGLSTPQQSVDAGQLSVEATYPESSLINLTLSLVRGANVPTANWNVVSSGRCSISGTYSGKYYLYSNYNILGKNTYNYYFHNQGRGTLEIRMRNSVNHAVLKTHFVPAGSTISNTLSMTDQSSRFYYEFYSTVDYTFSGYVQ
ncbi:hypothetical protein [Enterococcus mundtii]|uniref:hypothetical protein n=1 Tax=Enterococcus mundtii TaxID=53346 RepID=UPI002DBDC748|nr:hypothetical protein [Enterococcus mundtii]MEC3941227.1 hypothetical protein [Enterococcus mundtii]